jgi:hypothetical protein
MRPAQSLGAITPGPPFQGHTDWTSSQAANLSLMRWTVVAIGQAVVASLVAASWLGWVVSQGTNQLIQPGWRAFLYAGSLFVALVIAQSALITVRFKLPGKGTTGLAIRAVAGLESLVFGVVWFGLVVMPFPG